jgi:hypothetical protein
VVEHLHRGRARPAGVQGGGQRAQFDEARPAGVDEQRLRRHGGQVIKGDDAAGGVDRPQVDRDDVAGGEEGAPVSGDLSVTSWPSSSR